MNRIIVYLYTQLGGWITGIGYLLENGFTPEFAAAAAAFFAGTGHIVKDKGEEGGSGSATPIAPAQAPDVPLVPRSPNQELRLRADQLAEQLRAANDRVRTLERNIMNFQPGHTFGGDKPPSELTKALSNLSTKP